MTGIATVMCRKRDLVTGSNVSALIVSEAGPIQTVIMNKEL